MSVVAIHELTRVVFVSAPVEQTIGWSSRPGATTGFSGSGAAASSAPAEARAAPRTLSAPRPVPHGVPADPVACVSRSASHGCQYHDQQRSDSSNRSPSFAPRLVADEIRVPQKAERMNCI